MSYSGYKSDLTKNYSTGDIMSTNIYTTGVSTQPISGNFSHVILGGLLIQFGTGYNTKNSTVTLPVAYDAGTGSNTVGWKDPFLLFAIPWSSNTNLYITTKSTTSFSIAGMGSSNIFYNWITIGPVPTNYNGT